MLKYLETILPLVESLDLLNKMRYTHFMGGGAAGGL